jgi:hypothetical protein
VAWCLPVWGECAVSRATGPVRVHLGVGLAARGLAGGRGGAGGGGALAGWLDERARGDHVEVGDDVGQRVFSERAGLVGAQVAGQVVTGRAAGGSGLGLALAVD